MRRHRLARALARGADVLLLDEPTNHLTMPLVDHLLEGLEGVSAAVVVATHDRQVLRTLEHWPRLVLEPVGEPTCGPPDPASTM